MLQAVVRKTETARYIIMQKNAKDNERLEKSERER